MADLYAELGKLRRVIEELQPLADASQENYDKFVKAEDEAKEWKRVGMEAVNDKKETGERLAEERKLKAELGRQYDLRLKETEMANKKVERLMMDAKFDKQAREGQVKRSRIIQHELEETRQINGELEEKANMLESKNEELTRALNHERALRLQDLHRNMAMAGAKKVAETSEKNLEGRAAEVSSELEEASHKMRMFQATLRGMEKVASVHEQEMLLTRGELEEEKKQCMHFRHEFERVVATLEASVAAQRELEAEVSRLRREVVMSAHGSMNTASRAILGPRDKRAQWRAAQRSTVVGRLIPNTSKEVDVAALARSQSMMDFGQDYDAFEEEIDTMSEEEGAFDSAGGQAQRSQTAGNSPRRRRARNFSMSDVTAAHNPLEPGMNWREQPNDPFGGTNESLGSATRAYRSHSAAVASRIKNDARARHGLQHFGASAQIVGGEDGSIAEKYTNFSGGPDGIARGKSRGALAMIDSRRGVREGGSATPGLGRINYRRAKGRRRGDPELILSAATPTNVDDLEQQEGEGGETLSATPKVCICL